MITSTMSISGKQYRIDLHIHTSASRCFKSQNLSLQKINQQIIKEARQKRLDLIAITDHYSLKNVKNIQMIAVTEGITVLPGIEFSIKTHLPEKVSLLAIFDEKADLVDIENEVLLKLGISPENFGNGTLLINKPIADILKLINKFNGLIISSHQDKNESRMSLIPTLIGQGITLFDLRHPEKKDDFMENFAKHNIIPLTFSDAHKISDIGKYFMELPIPITSFNNLKKYLRNLKHKPHLPNFDKN